MFDIRIADAVRKVQTEDFPTAVFLLKQRAAVLGLYKAMAALDAVGEAACEEMAERQLAAKITQNISSTVAR